MKAMSHLNVGPSAAGVAIALAVSTLSAPAQMPPREVSARTIPVPEAVSPQMQKLIAASRPSGEWNEDDYDVLCRWRCCWAHHEGARPRSGRRSAPRSDPNRSRAYWAQRGGLSRLGAAELVELEPDVP